MARIKFTFNRECKKCSESFKPKTKKTWVCDYCYRKAYDFGRVRKANNSFRVMLVEMKKDSKKTWYKLFKGGIAVFDKIIKEMSKDFGDGRKKV